MDTDITGVKRTREEEEFTPLPRNRPRKGPQTSIRDQIDLLAEEMFTQDSIQDGILGMQSPHAK
ncbi:hypothetical protein DPMN_045818 [Dreissena polymorpha]|uniref:Uncharacterized protein n=1 Tax=Dreissena polymorpha TaxID=45954 RepID=A0A9D4D4U1_DREPO|nr:hypothetical protein DPMN_045818 [Dreissena polymorpha]